MTPRKPKDINNLRQCVRTDKDGDYLVFCVECDLWRQVAIQYSAMITCYIIRDTTRETFEDKYNFSLVCATCFADVEYLFSPLQRKSLVDKVL